MRFVFCEGLETYKMDIVFIAKSPEYNLQGYSAETSGGLLMSISAEGAKAFADEILALEGQPAWVIGSVEVNQPLFLSRKYF